MRVSKLLMYTGVLLMCVSASAQTTTEPDGTVDQDDPLAREQYLVEKRGGDAPEGARIQALQEVDALIQKQNQLFLQGVSDPNYNIAANASAWTFIGPSHTIGNGAGNTSGRVSAIAVDPTDSNVVYAGGAQGGVWKSTDGGLTWTALTDDQISLAIGSIAIDPNNHNTVYVGTGEQNYSSDSYYGGGILKSTDGGVSWTRLTNSNFDGSGTRASGFPSIGAMAVQPGVAAGTTPIVLAAVRSSTGGIYVSQDGGATWVKATGMPASLSAANSVVYVSNTVAYAGLYANGVYKSTDGGLTWAAANGNATGGVVTITSTQRAIVGASPADPNTVYATLSDATSGGNNLSGAYKTTDGGLTWTKFVVGTGAFVDFCTPQCWYDMTIAVNPVNASKVFFGGSSVASSNFVMYSGDGGSTWSGKATGIHVDEHAGAFDATGAVLYWGNDGGIYKTTNTSGLTSAAVTWTNLNSNIGITQFYSSIAINPNDPTQTYGGAQDNGVQQFPNSLIWNYMTCGDGAGAAFDANVPTTVYANCQNIDVRKSTTGAANSFNSISSAKITTERVQFIAPLLGDGKLSNPTRIYFGTFRVWMTADGGTTWNPISLDMTGGSGTITKIAIAPGNKDAVYVVTTDGKVQQSSNATQAVPATFTNITGTGLPAGRLNSVAVDASGTVYVVASNFTAGSKVFKLVSGSTAWTNISGDIPNSPVNDIVVDPDVPNTIYVGTDVGVFKTSNGGTNWVPQASGFPRVAVYGLVLHEPSRTLRAATHGRGLWDLAIPLGTTLNASPASLSFASQLVGSSSAVQTVTLTAQLGGVTISGITISGDYSQTNTCGASLSAGQSCTVSVTFTPTVAGTRTGSVSIATNLAGSPQTIALSGLGNSPAPTVTLSPASLAFGSITLGSASAAVTETLSNSGSAVLNISSITVSPSDYTDTTTCGATLANGSSCSISVTFRPAATGSRAGTLSIADNAVGSPHTVAISGTGSGSTATLSPSSVAFGSQPVGTASSPVAVTVTNSGNLAMSITSIAVSPADYSATNTCGASLAAGASCTVSITFAPSTGTSIPGTLTLTDSATGSPQTAALSGTGVAPADSISTTSLTYATQSVGTASAAQTVTLTNSGNATLSITGVTLTGDFQQTSTCGATLAAGASCAYSITFNPTASGSRTGSLTISDNAVGSPRTVSLSGSAIAPVASLSPGTLTFADQTAGTTSPVQTVTLTNTGTGTLSFTNFAMTGDYAQTNTCGLTLASGASCVFSVTFTPQSGGTITGSLVITDNAAGSPHTVSLTGNGIIAAGLSFSTTTVTFPGQTVNTSSASQGVTVTNSASKYGGSVVNINSITVSGDFQMSNGCGNSIAVNANCPITVSFVPTGTGTRTGVVTMVDNASGSAHTIALSGMGTSPSVSLSPSTLSFPNTNAGATSAAQNVTLNNTGSGPLSITSIATGGDFQQTNTCGTSLASASSCTISVTFVPTAGGARAGSLTITDNAGGSPRNVALSGTGLVPAGSSIAPASLSYNSQLVGTTSAAQIVNLSNAPTKYGSSVLNISSVTVTGDFQQTNNCGSAVQSGASCSFNVVFMPTATGSRTGTLTVVDDGAGSPHTVALSGSAVAPVASFSPASVAFGNQSVNVSSAPQNITLSNTGTATLNIASITATGAMFKQTNTCPASLTAGNGCTISVTFTPTANGAASGSISVADDAAGSPQSIALSGSGVVLSTSISPASVVFATSQKVGTTSQAQTVTLTNTGNVALSISGIVTSAEFAQTTKCTSSLAAGASCTIAVKFSPIANGTRPGTLTITDNSPGSPHVISLSGTGTGGRLAFSDADLSFGSQVLSSPVLPPQYLKLTNYGNVTATLSSITGSSPEFVPSSNCDAILLAGASCIITVEFHPTGMGVRTGSITVASSDTDPVTTTVSGNVVDFTLVLSRPSRPGRNGVVAGSSAQFSVSVSSTGVLPTPPTATCSGAPRNSQCSLQMLPGPNGSVAGMVVNLRTTQRRSARLHDRNSAGTPAGQYTMTVTATSGGATRTVAVPVTVY